MLSVRKRLSWRGWVLMSLTLVSFTVSAHLRYQVFVSFSMPEQLLKETLQESARLNIPAYLNGLYHNSLPETAAIILTLSKEVPGLHLAIDPTAFERFHIQQVPALVVENEAHQFDVIYGHLSLIDGLRRMTGHNDSGLTLKTINELIHG